MMNLSRQHRSAIADQENTHAIKGKTGAVLATKRQGLSSRGALGEINVNIQHQREVTLGKVAVTGVDIEKSATVFNRSSVRSTSYKHVQSKIDTGLSRKPNARPPLRREESTSSLALRASVQTKVILKDNDVNEIKEATKQLKHKKNVETKEEKVKPINKDPTESLKKLQLTDTENLPNNRKVEEISSKEEKKENKNEVGPLQQQKPVNIDTRNVNNFILVPDYVQDIYNYLNELELKFAIEPDHLRRQVEITGHMRAILVDWLADVADHLQLELETLHLAIGIIDRYLQVAPKVKRTEFQLVGITALYLASKYEEVYPPCPEDYVSMSDNAYSIKDIMTYERNMIKKLEFCLARPVPLSFLRRFLMVSGGSPQNHNLAKFFVDLCLVEYSMAHYRPSMLAAAAICLSLHLLSDKELQEVWTPTMVYYSTYKLKHIYSVIKKMAKIVVGNEKSKLRSVCRIYSQKRGRVALIPQLKGKKIRELAN